MGAGNASTTPVRAGQPPLLNFRDVGGLPVAGGGRTRYGLLYRSAAPGMLDEAGRAALGALGLRTVFDLRTEPERMAHPDRLPPGVSLVSLDVLADGDPRASPSRMIVAMRDPARARTLLADGGAVRFFERQYGELVALGSARAAYGRLFRDLAEVGTRPALVHCTTGKDRTGWAVALLLMLLGVPDDAVVAEYLLGNDELERAFRGELDAFAAADVDRGLVLPLVGVRRSYLETALATMRSRYGTLERYAAEGLGLDEATRRALGEVFVEPGVDDDAEPHAG